MNKQKLKIILIIIFFIGISILLYPFISEYWNSKVQSQAIADYDEMLSKIETKDYSVLFTEIENYNKQLYKQEYPLVQYKTLSNDLEIFNITTNGMIGYITIEKIKVKLPIYHGTDSSILNTAVGHLAGTSLPIGGESTHSALSAHRGLPSAKLFTNLDKLEIGDIFEITILDRILTYQVDKIKVVEPNDVTELNIIEKEDYVTLITCTPYGLNTHRLLVRGTRIENKEEKKLIITDEANKIDKTIVALIMAIPILIILILYIMIKPSKKKKYEEGDLN